LHKYQKFYFSQEKAEGELVKHSELNEETMCHPELYPDGKNGLGADREIKLKPSQFAKAKLNNKDPRWRQSPGWIFTTRSRKDKV
jgi:hypothetical protein